MPYNGANFMEWVLFEQLIQLFSCRNCPPFTKSKGSLLCSEETVSLDHMLKQMNQVHLITGCFYF